MSDAGAAPLEFDLVVIGGGSGGLAGAFRAARHGARVALLEPGELGGTCVNRGCVPKKAMWLAADLSHRIALAARMGFDVPPPALDWCEFVAHRQGYIAGIHAGYRQRLDESGIVLMPTRGRLAAAGRVETEDGVALRAAHVLIATGGHPRVPAIPGAGLGVVSDDFFHFRSAPGRVAIVGGGYIAAELASVLQALGSRVELFVRGQRLLEEFDADLASQLVEDFRHYGTRVHFGHAVHALEAMGTGKIALRDAHGATGEAFDRVIFATGRNPNTHGLGLESVGVACDARGHVVVDARQDTSVAGIHAVGDVTGQAALTPVAIAAARCLMDRLFGGRPEARLDPSDIATVVFAHPPLGKVGLTEAEARTRHGDAVRVHRAGFRPMLHALAGSPQRSLFKLVCVPGCDGNGDDPATQRVVGIHLLGESADEILQGFAVALKRGITMRDLEDTIAIHPTSAEEVVLMR